MPEQLLTILKICFLVLLYLFFLRVLRAVWTELQTADGAALGVATPSGTAANAAVAATTAAAGASAPAPDVPTSLVALAPPELAGRTWTLHGDMRIGRAEHADIRIEDTFISAEHARLVFRHVSWILEDLGSTNGTRLNDVAIAGAAVISIGDRIGVGTAVLEAR